MGFFEFLFGLIVFSTLLSLSLTFLLGRAAWRGGRRLLDWARERKALPGVPQNPSTEAQDVVVEREDGLRRQSRPRHADYVRLSVDLGTTATDVAKVMRGYVGDPAMGPYAQAVIDTLDSAALRRESLFAELDGTFQRGTISWDKFAMPSHAALDAILRNSALLANRIQSFDTASYLRLKEGMGTSWRRGTSDDGETRAERWDVFKETLASLDTVQETNEGLLLELDKLATELSTIGGSETNGRGDSIIGEIRRLVEEAKYYR